ncbi:MAG: MBOAT family protein [Chitinophagales bacterium]|nr:MBOAT family protein [Chitinophagaceae bacterium]MCB9063843.1 MBOAT family protein [Chitinophagales bacterium]
MIFNSTTFLIFLPIAFFLYWVINKYGVKYQNLLLLALSYIFYGWWDWVFLSLIVVSTLVDYIAAHKIGAATDTRIKKRWLALSVVVNLGLLGVFKYFDFFADSLANLFTSIGYDAPIYSLGIILPVGISFYTFQTMSYTIDVYYGRMKPEKDLVAFGTYVAFFPQLVAGPIERATSLLPQITRARQFKYRQGVEGLRLILYGMFKKVVIADSLAKLVDPVFGNPAGHNGTTLFVSCIYFGIQIYCDFSGYSDIAIGTAKLFGIELRSNFKFPYFTTNIIDFWKRWHISLSTWFRDYVYIPLGGSRGSRLVTARNLFIVFMVSGLWHGANWTYVIWGMIHGVLYLITYFFFKPSAKHRILSKVIGFIITSLTITLAWPFFRCESIAQAAEMVKRIVLFAFTPLQYGQGLIYVGTILLMDMLIFKNEREPVPFKKSFLRKLYYSILIIAIATNWSHQSYNFIYFQF